MKKLSNKGAALITGGAVRLGKAIAIHLAETGFDIALHYNTSKKEAEKTAKEIKLLGRKCELFKADLADIKSVKKLGDSAAITFKDLNVLINNASIFERVSFLETDEEVFERHFNINFKAPFFLTQNFARNLRKKHLKSGNIINILDTHITKTKTPFFAYLLSKKVLFDFTRQAAVELGPDIRVNAVAPGIVLPSKIWGADYIKRKTESLPLKTTATPEAVSHAISAILENEILTGQCIFVDGGENIL